MKLIQIQKPELLKGSWAWVTPSGLELDPIFSSAEEAFLWYDNYKIIALQDSTILLRMNIIDGVKSGKSVLSE